MMAATLMALAVAHRPGSATPSPVVGAAVTLTAMAKVMTMGMVSVLAGRTMTVNTALMVAATAASAVAAAAVVVVVVVVVGVRSIHTRAWAPTCLMTRTMCTPCARAAMGRAVDTAPRCRLLLQLLLLLVVLVVVVVVAHGSGGLQRCEGPGGMSTAGPWAAMGLTMTTTMTTTTARRRRRRWLGLS